MRLSCHRPAETWSMTTAPPITHHERPRTCRAAPVRPPSPGRLEPFWRTKVTVPVHMWFAFRSPVIHLRALASRSSAGSRWSRGWRVKVRGGSTAVAESQHSMEELEEAQDAEKIVREVIEHLRERLPQAPEEEVQQTVVGLFDQWADSPVRSFLPVLVEKEARERLRRRVPLSV